MLEDGDLVELKPTEYACQNYGCWLIHLRAAGDLACDSAPS